MSEEELQLYKEIIYADKVFHINFQNISKKLYKEIERLNNIINELERKLLSTYSTYVSMDKVPEIAKYIRELKGSE